MKRTERVTIRIDHKLLEELRQIASAESVNVSNLVRRFLVEAVDRRAKGTLLAG